MGELIRPDFRAQFRDAERPKEYMGGYTASCGNHPNLPKRHRWSAVRSYQTSRGTWYDRMCLNCSLCEDYGYVDSRAIAPASDRG